MRGLSKFARLFGALGLFVSTSLAQAQQVTLALPGPGVLHAAEFIADEQGFWKAHGLDVKTPIIPGPGALNAMMAGSADVTIAAPGSLFVALARGQNLQAIANTYNQITSQIVLRRDVVERLGVAPSADLETRIAALKGLSLGVDSINGIGHSVLRYLANKSELNPEVDLTVSPMQSPSMPAALQARRVDGFVSAAPWTTLAVLKGEGVLWIRPGEELPEIHPFPANVIVVRGGYCEQNESICKKYLAGISDALNFIHEQPEAAYELVRKRAGSQVDPDVMAETWATARPMFTDSPAITEEALKNVENFAVRGGMITENDRVKNWDAVINNKYSQ